VPNVKVRVVFAFVQRADDSVGVWAFAKKQVAKFLVLWNDCAALGKSLQTIGSFSKAELCAGTFRRVGLDGAATSGVPSHRKAGFGLFWLSLFVAALFPLQKDQIPSGSQGE
jgi:hypothetical protein